MMELERDTERSRQKQGRPRQVVPTRLVRITLSLRPGQDADLLAFFERLPAGQRAQAVKRALRRSGIGWMPDSGEVPRSL
jgi:hypothetical protein